MASTETHAPGMRSLDVKESADGAARFSRRYSTPAAAKSCLLCPVAK